MTQQSTVRASDPLLQPLSIKKLVLRNRIMSTSHACGLERDGFPQDAYQAYHEEKAKGGLALTMFAVVTAPFWGIGLIALWVMGLI